MGDLILAGDSGPVPFGLSLSRMPAATRGRGMASADPGAYVCITLQDLELPLRTAYLALMTGLLSAFAPRTRPSTAPNGVGGTVAGGGGGGSRERVLEGLLRVVRDEDLAGAGRALDAVFHPAALGAPGGPGGGAGAGGGGGGGGMGSGGGGGGFGEGSRAWGPERLIVWVAHSWRVG
jgi:hypothetical protein